MLDAVLRTMPKSRRDRLTLLAVLGLLGLAAAALIGFSVPGEWWRKALAIGGTIVLVALAAAALKVAFMSDNSGAGAARKAKTTQADVATVVRDLRELGDATSSTHDQLIETRTDVRGLRRDHGEVLAEQEALRTELTAAGKALDQARSELAAARKEAATRKVKRSRESAFHPVTVDDVDPTTNLQWNLERWGQEAGWAERDEFGYRWGGGRQHTTGSVAAFWDEHFRPFTDDRYDLKILEIGPGAGRSTAELVRYAAEMCLVDLNTVAIDLCKQRLSYLLTTISYVVNDGQSLEEVPTTDFDAVVSYDTMVHMHPKIVREYVRQIAELLVDGGFAWLDHSGKGEKVSGHRSAMTAELMAEFAGEVGLVVVDQRFRNDWDCISVLKKEAAR